MEVDEVDEDMNALEEDPPPEAGEEFDNVNWSDCARIWSLVVPMRLTWYPTPLPVRLLTV